MNEDTMGIIRVDTEKAKRLGFTSAYFTAGSYLWEEGDDLYIPRITSKNGGDGNFRGLLDILESKYKRIIVPTPKFRMAKILYSRGYIMCYWDDRDSSYQALVWEK